MDRNEEREGQKDKRCGSRDRTDEHGSSGSRLLSSRRHDTRTVRARKPSDTVTRAFGRRFGIAVGSEAPDRRNRPGRSVPNEFDGPTGFRSRSPPGHATALRRS